MQCQARISTQGPIAGSVCVCVYVCMCVCLSLSLSHTPTHTTHIKIHTIMYARTPPHIPTATDKGHQLSCQQSVPLPKREKDLLFDNTSLT